MQPVLILNIVNLREEEGLGLNLSIIFYFFAQWQIRPGSIFTEEAISCRSGT